MEEIWSDKDKFREIMQETTLPYKDFMFDNKEMKIKCWKALIREWDIVKKYAKKEYPHPKELKINI